MLFTRVANRFRHWVQHTQYQPSLLGAMTRALCGIRLPFSVAHVMNLPEHDAMGPVQQSEALLLYAITRVVRPRLILEFGFSGGHSAETFLAAADWDLQIHSFDITEAAEARARQLEDGRRFFFHRKSQDLFRWDDINNSPIDLVFLDASHDLQVNQITWNLFLPCLAPTAIVAVHDTGTWARRYMTGMHHEAAHHLHSAAWLSESEFAHQLDERLFVNWLRETHPEFAQIHFHSTTTLRHGMTILQRSTLLPVTTTSTQ